MSRQHNKAYSHYSEEAQIPLKRNLHSLITPELLEIPISINLTIKYRYYEVEPELALNISNKNYELWLQKIFGEQLHNKHCDG